MPNKNDSLIRFFIHETHSNYSICSTNLVNNVIMNKICIMWVNHVVKTFEALRNVPHIPMTYILDVRDYFA